MLTTPHTHEFAARIGEELGASPWVEVTQDAIDALADLIRDRQWIHTEPERARATPFGGTIAHGYYTLALAPALLAQVLPLTLTLTLTFERPGGGKPVCVAQALYRLLEERPS